MLIIFVHGVLVFGFTTRVLLRDDLAPSSRLAWFMVILIVPIFGSLIYFLFGEINLGSTADARRQIFDAVKTDGVAALGDATFVDQSIDPIYQSAFKFASSINGFYTVGGNHAELMPDAGSARERLIGDLDNAKDTINLLYYIWLEDNTGTNIAQALIRATERGVVCRAMADGLGSKKMISSTLWQEMKQAGVHLSIALPLDRPVHTLLTSRLDLRNHRKITIIDGRITYCGSQNCADPEFRVKAKYAPWIDIMLRLEGPVVAQNQLLFASDWLVYQQDEMSSFPLITTDSSQGFPAQMIGDGPTERSGAAPQLFASLIHTATKTMTISTPYFVPNTIVLNAIYAAAYRGVRVVLIIPKHNDSWIVAAASRSYYKSLLKSGVLIHEFSGGLLHSKTLTIDGRITFMGSTNMDLRSFDLNYENDILLQDEATTLAVQKRQQDYLKDSIPVELNEVEQWTIHRRIWNNVIATAGPVL